MAFSIVESITPSNQDGGSTSFVMAMPATRPDGDLYIAWVTKDDNDAFTSIPGNWIEIDIGVSGTSVRMGLWYWFGNSEPASYTLQGDSEEWSGAIIRISGVDPTTPINKIGTATTGTDATAEIPQVTPDVDDPLLLAFAGIDTDFWNTANQYPSGWTGLFTQNSGSSEYGSANAIGASREGQNGVASGAGAFTANGSDEWRAITIAVAPAAGVVAPTVTTQAVSGISTYIATGNGTIEDTGGENCSKRGVCWNTTGNPTVADNKSEETNSFGIGAFVSPMTGLLAETHYYVRTYAYNSVGYGYGSQVEFDTQGAGSTLYEYYNTGDDDADDWYGKWWSGQTFTPAIAHKITSVKLKLYRSGSPGTITVSIRATSGGLPVGGDLCSGTTDGDTLTTDTDGEWREITLGAGYNLSADTKYAIVVRALDGDTDNRVWWRLDETSPAYTDGEFVYSSTSGGSWSSIAWDAMFEEWGEPAVTEKNVSDTGSGVDAKASGNPLATFPVRSETGGGVDGHKAVAPQSAGETGAGVDALTALLGILARSETGLGIDAKLSLAVALIKADAGSGVEHILDRALVLISESGSGLDVSHLVKTLMLTDGGTAAENSYLYILAGVKSSSDTGAGAEASSLAALLQRDETGEGVESIVARALYAREYPTGALDLAKVITAAITGAETGTGAEASLQSYYLKKTDSGSGVDASSLVALFTGEDSGAGAEAITLLAAMVSHDTGVGVEVVIDFFRKLIDSGQGEENLHLVGLVGRLMKLITYTKPYSDLVVYTRPYSDLIVYTSEVEQ